MQCIHTNSEKVLVSIEAQTLSYLNKTYEISTSKFGIGSEEGSNKTPLGHFQVSEKFGDGEPLFSRFKARKRVGIWSPEQNDLKEDGILSRIIRLSGLEKENSNTYQRYIYLHGTNDESGIGAKKSIGCVRMRNLDIITLYNQLPLGTYVHIT